MKKKKDFVKTKKKKKLLILLILCRFLYDVQKGVLQKEKPVSITPFPILSIKHALFFKTKITSILSSLLWIF